MIKLFMPPWKEDDKVKQGFLKLLVQKPWKKDDKVKQGFLKLLVQKREFLGLEVEAFLEAIMELKNTSYPYYNVRKKNENIIIEIAVAGFDKKELSVIWEHMKLVVEYKKQPKEEDGVLLFQGIAKRSFKKVFPLGEGMQVTKAKLEDGLLLITITTIENKKQSIKINIT